MIDASIMIISGTEKPDSMADERMSSFDQKPPTMKGAPIRERIPTKKMLLVSGILSFNPFIE